MKCNNAVKAILVSVSSLFILVCAPAPANSCQCVNAGSPCEEFGEATTVFIGQVLSSEKVESGMNYVTAPEKIFKGSPENSLLFFSCFECMCTFGYQFSVE